jgi:hypothetical protein
MLTLIFPEIYCKFKILWSQGFDVFRHIHVSGTIVIIITCCLIDFFTYTITVKASTIVKTGNTYEFFIYTILELMLVIYVPKIFKPSIKAQVNKLLPDSYNPSNIYKTCVHADHMEINNIAIDLDKNKLTIKHGYEWIKGIFSKFQNKIDFANFVNGHCNNNQVELAAKCMYPSLFDSSLKYYHNCIITLLTAIKRQLAQMPEPDKDLVNSVSKFFKDKYINGVLSMSNKKYYASFNAWFNNLNAMKQNEIKKLVEDNNLKGDIINCAAKLLKECIRYTTFVKGELQFEGEESKTRNICNVSTWRKLAIGFLIWSIEIHSRRYIKYYSSGKSYSAKAKDRKEILNKLGKDVVCLSLDFSAFDSTQHVWWKEAIDDQLYNWAVHLLKKQGVKHKYFSLTDILKVALDHRAHIQVGQYINGKFEEVCNIVHNGTVHSGDPDTTLGNTWRTLVIFDYMFREVLKLKQSDYEIRSSGDDVDLYIRRKKFNKQLFCKVFNDFFLNKNTYKPEEGVKMTHGTGMMMKMVNIYEGAESESCSTFGFENEFGDVSIIRQPHRFVKTLSYIDKNCTLNDLQYTNAIAQCNYAWSHDIVGIKTFLKKMIKLTNTILYSKKGDTREILPLSDSEKLWLEDDGKQDIINPFSYITSNPYKYGEKIMDILPKIQRKANNKASKIFLEKYYDIDDEDIANLKEKIKLANDVTELFTLCKQTRFMQKLGKLQYKPVNIMNEKY